ncbi:MAG: L-2-amino-thiazoline-4-carboxylic acid hydrolase [Alphaproteobacteria bacterium]|nr:L-2-amino-thiazoline-4-carboxylic acid hydrolase [Alphaproteobacteria bacterium]MDX5370708.1 L-2-amino-thiazoline-4-carboxylic acid hydrolase [Alphaproteobacteria bacterium]MDX5465125.1 L-2-amino-thiazoline-4-carboxylic acid hydrolase [Alphaproteobacteria bacterium]
MSELTNLDRRRIQGEIVKPIYEELLAEVGPDKAREILSRAITRSAVAEARKAAEAAEGGTSMEAFTENFNRTYRNRGSEAGIEVDVLSEGPDHLDFNVTRCRFVEMYRDLGLGDIADVLSCNRDGVFAQAYDPDIDLDRAQTIAQGAPCCTFRYRFRRRGGDGRG